VAGLLACLVPAALALAEGQRLLSADDAFHIGARRTGDRVIDVDFDMAPGYVLYQDHFQFSTNATAVTVLPSFPPASSRYIEALDKTVSYYSNHVTIHLAVKGGAAPFTLIVGAQGCAIVQGVCYPPVKKDFTVPALGAR
jgi:thiol:disulfide interchange protein DsbD